MDEQGQNSRHGGWKVRKVELPPYSGGNPDEWILRVERYFSYYNLTEEAKLEAAAISMEGDAQFWFQWEDQDSPITWWQDFKMLLLRRFRPHNQGGLVEQWLAVKHEQRVEDYCKNYVEKMNPLSRILVDISLRVLSLG